MVNNYGLPRLPPLTLAMSVPDELRQQVIAYYCVGLSEEKACLAAGLNDEDIENLTQDPAWGMVLAAKRAQQVSLRAEQLGDMVGPNMRKGVSVELRKILEVLDPEDFGSKATVSLSTPDIPEPEVKVRE